MRRNRFYTIQKSIAAQIARAQADQAEQPGSLDNAALAGGNAPASGEWVPTGQLDLSPLTNFRLK